MTGLAVAGRAVAQDAAPQDEPIPSHPVHTLTVPGPCSDRACLARAYMEDAQEACAPLIERLAERDAEWIYRPSAGIFDRFDWPDEAGTTIRYKGDRIRFQTPSGSWARMTYECGYDVARGQALFARAERGRQGPGRASVAEDPRIEAAPVQSAATVAPDAAPAVVPEEASEPRRAAPTPQRAVRATPAKSVKSARAAVKRAAKKARAAPARAKKKTVVRKSNAKPRAVKRTGAKKARKSR